MDLCNLDIGYCNACGTCYATGECTQIDDFVEIFEKMMNADGIVLGAPNYIDSVPAPMKALFDRMAYAIHCQMLTGKLHRGPALNHRRDIISDGRDTVRS